MVGVVHPAEAAAGRAQERVHAQELLDAEPLSTQEIPNTLLVNDPAEECIHPRYQKNVKVPVDNDLKALLGRRASESHANLYQDSGKIGPFSTGASETEDSSSQEASRPSYRIRPAGLIDAIRKSLFKKPEDSQPQNDFAPDPALYDSISSKDNKGMKIWQTPADTIQ